MATGKKVSKRATKKKTSSKKATKKKASRKKKEPGPEQYLRSDGNKYLTEEDRLKYHLAEQKYQNKQMARLLKEQELQKFTDKAMADISALKRAEVVDLREILELRSELGKKYGVDFSAPGFTWDDETGRMVVFEPPIPGSTGGADETEGAG